MSKKSVKVTLMLMVAGMALAFVPAVFAADGSGFTEDSLRKLTEEMISKLIDSNANSRAGSIQLPSLGYQAEEDKYTYKEPLEKVMNQLKEEYLLKGVPTE